MNAPNEQPTLDKDDQEQRARRSIYLLPNLFTTGALFGGFYAIVAAMSGRFEAAAIAVFIAMVLDGIDGRVARMTNTQSAFGAEYDSLSDMVSFGLAPALVMYEWALVHMKLFGAIPGKIGWLAAFFYAAMAAMRLARFNTQVGKVDKRYFHGLPSPTAAAILMSMVWTLHGLDIQGESVRFPALFVTIVVGALMVSNFRYYSFKDLDFRNRVPFAIILLIVPVLMVAALAPAKVLFAAATGYALSGPILALLRWRRRRVRRSESQ
ncbi:MAG: CDP-diacylglycerol--serine O-phosphatidyltransferase [Gammaproteobacteria bacterium]|jgi:CDP-diacylglycerol--serine O-phosphatidyltransferase